MSTKPARKKAKKRDYKEEYRRRIERAAKLGIPKSVARGHAKKGTYGIKEARKANRIPGAAIRHGDGRTDAEKLIDRLEKLGFVDPLKESRRRWLIRNVPGADGLKKRMLKRLVTTQEDFITIALESGHSQNEAYTAWFSPK